MPFDGQATDYLTIPAEDVEPSLEGLLRFCESRPADATYDYNDCFGACLLDQYVGHKTGWKEYIALAEMGGGKAGEYVAATEPHTYGAAADRCRALLAGRPGP